MKRRKWYSFFIIVLLILPLAQELLSSDSPVKAQTEPMVWTQIGLAGISISLVGADPSNPDTIYVVQSDGYGMLKTTDGGQTWIPINTGFPDYPLITSLAIHPDNHNILFVSTLSTIVFPTFEFGGIFRTIDGGASWAKTLEGLDFWKVIIDPHNPDTIYAAGSSYYGSDTIFKSTDGGSTWTEKGQGLTASPPLNIFIDPTNSQMLYVTSNGSGIFKSTDGAESWTPYGNGMPTSGINTLVINPQNSQILFAGMSSPSGGVHKSTDGGSTWTEVSNGLTGVLIGDLILDPENPNTLYASGHELGWTESYGAFKTTNGGAIWEPMNDGFPTEVSALNIFSFAIRPGDPRHLLAGTLNGVWQYLLPSSPPEKTLAEKAADLAKVVVEQSYLTGGKGWDFTKGSYVEPEHIGLGYDYCRYNSETEKCDIIFDDGVDCSGLVMWSYNKAFGSTKYLSEDNPVRYEGAAGQFQHNFTQEVSESDLKPGDLLFFNIVKNPSGTDHVAMYVGGDGEFDIIHASAPGVGIIWDKVSRLKDLTGFDGFRRLSDPQIGFEARGLSPIDLVITEPDGFTITPGTLIVTELERLREVPGELYYSEWDIDGDGELDDLVYAPELKLGDYLIRVTPETDASPTDTYTLEVEVAGTIITLARDVSISDIPSLGYGIRSAGTEITPFIPVAIDIKPGSDPNSINCNNEKGVIPVAILTTDDFDATTVNHTTVTFEGASEMHVDKKTGEPRRHEEDVHGDGDIDLVFHLRLGETALTCESTEGTLTGKTFDSQLIEGTDSVRMVD